MILEEQGERLHEETIPIKAAEIQTERKTRVIKMSGISGDWYEALKGEFSKPYYRTLFQTVNEEYRTRLIFRRRRIYLNAFHLTPLKKVKVVILGQDPYPNPGQYYGVCFSVPKGIAIPGSLANYIQGNTSGLGKAHSDFRKSGPLGSARRVSYEFRPHSTCPRNRLAPEHGMGNLHRRCYQETE